MALFPSHDLVGGGIIPVDGLRLWLRADLGITTISGDVTEWLDQSPQGNNATQPNIGTDAPSFSPGGLNGQDAVDFEQNNSEFMFVNAALATDFSGTDPEATILSVFQTETLQAGFGTIVGFGNSTSNIPFWNSFSIANLSTANGRMRLSKRDDAGVTTSPEARSNPLPAGPKFVTVRTNNGIAIDFFVIVTGKQNSKKEYY